MEQSFTIGIICNGYNTADIEAYAPEFKIINRLFKGKVQLLLIGLNGENLPKLKDVEYTYTKVVSISHWFKHLHALEFDMLFIPLIKGEYNASSENYNKYMEAALFGVPVITLAQHPYNMIIQDKQNGFLYKDKESFIDELKFILVSNLHLVKMCGQEAMKITTNNLAYTNENTSELDSSFD